MAELLSTNTNEIQQVFTIKNSGDAINDINFDIASLRRQFGVFAIQKASDGDNTVMSSCLIHFRGGYTNEGLQMLIYGQNAIKVRTGYSDGSGFSWNPWRGLSLTSI